MTPLDQALRPPPPVPSLTPIYKSTQTTTTDEDTTTFADVDIGVPHPKRLVVLGTFVGVAGNPTTLVNGTNPVVAEPNGIPRYATITAHRVPNGTTASISATCASALRKAIAVWVYYPNSPFLLSWGQQSPTVGTPFTASLTVQAGGAVFYAMAQLAISTGTFSTTWGGTETPVEDVDAQIESASSYTMGHVNILSSSTNTLTVSKGTSGAAQASALVLGPPYG